MEKRAGNIMSFEQHASYWRLNYTLYSKNLVNENDIQTQYYKTLAVFSAL